jgi:hypothetical protein
LCVDKWYERPHLNRLGHGHGLVLADRVAFGALFLAAACVGGPSRSSPGLAVGEQHGLTGPMPGVPAGLTGWVQSAWIAVVLRQVAPLPVPSATTSPSFLSVSNASLIVWSLTPGSATRTSEMRKMVAASLRT